MDKDIEKIVDLVGGEDNVSEAFNCMTRLRFRVKDRSKIDEEGLKDQDSVLGVTNGEDQLQVIVGPGKAQKMGQRISEMFNFAHGSNGEDESQQAEDAFDWKSNKSNMTKKSAVSEFLKKIGAIFVPLIPAFIAAGILLGISNIVENANAGVPTDALPAYYQFMKMIATGLYSFLAIYVGINTAKVFGGTEILGGIMGAISLSITNLPALFTQLGFSESFSQGMTAKGGVIGIILAVMFMSWFEKKIRKYIPDVIDLIVTPLITIVVSAAVLVFGCMAIAGYLTDGINIMINLLLNTNGFVTVLSSALIAGLFLPLVTVGLHQGFGPIYQAQIDAVGYTVLFPIAAMAGAGQVGAAISIYFQAKKVGNRKLTEVITGSLLPGFLGVGEPLIYGVTLPLGKPFITAGFGAAFGGAWIGLRQVGAVGFGPSGLSGLPLILPTKILDYIIGLIIAYIAGFVITRIFYKYEGN